VIQELEGQAQLVFLNQLVDKDGWLPWDTILYGFRRAARRRSTAL
jgi:hypothetical protein